MEHALGWLWQWRHGKNFLRVPLDALDYTSPHSLGGMASEAKAIETKSLTATT